MLKSTYVATRWSEKLPAHDHLVIKNDVGTTVTYVEH